MSQGRPTDTEVDIYARAIVLESKSQSEAFRAAFKVKPETKDESVHQKASKVHKMDKVQSRIKELQAESKRISEETFKITAEDKKNWLKIAVRLGLGLDEDMRPINSEEKPQISAAVAAIAEMNRMDGDHAPVKSDIKTKITGGKKRWQVELVDPGAKK